MLFHLCKKSATFHQAYIFVFHFKNFIYDIIYSDFSKENIFSYFLLNQCVAMDRIVHIEFS